MNVSLEVEYWVVDDDGDLVPPDTLLDVSEQVDQEFVEPMIELKTTPCASTAALRTEFRSLLETVVDAASDHDRHLVPLATPLTTDPRAVTCRDKRATDLQQQIVGPTFDDARVCAGTHIHVEQADDESAVADQLNALTAIDPAFALVTSSSHYRGEPLVECARPYLYRRSCYGACPEQGQLWPYVDSVDEWEARLECSYVNFRERALERGVDPDEFDETFDPYEAVWTPVRLRKAMPTVEWRSPDVALPSQLFDLVEAVADIAERAATQGTVVDGDSRATRETAFVHDEDAIGDVRPASSAAQRGRPGRPGGDETEPVGLPDFETVEATTDEAITDGLESRQVRRYLDEMGVTPSRFEPLVSRLPDTRLTDRRAKRYRLEAASWLEAEVSRHRARA
ncbi:glutamate-cysteine ligase family protein [Natrarchaeobaculum aegyptiacum]|uniref:Glutamate--cysteine ligase n=1 Tax=Natrarchaeobaculum aegyptiacum TaxID=745377 RepID=A0A2Z2HUL0_9EURY|nr:glutamate-cysteine ligase family protein [Natrarchaeobaculum aegyptiacum]ARS89835.1 glutamate--cysteine ligase [Natrarchaeobaculum aegyptiacum]